mmetsp:Transcript_85456/g.204799  ORF Transcript_85456/g.204799 Transcript_85456/m.204799 type:complete len:221 (-) Transcript_85456:476-1138(-)
MRAVASLLPLASIVPSCAQSNDLMPPVCPDNVANTSNARRSCGAEEARHRTMVESASPAATTTRALSGRHATARTESECPGKTANCSQRSGSVLDAFQIRAVLSSPPVNTLRPQGDQETARRISVCPQRMPFASHVRYSEPETRYTRASLSMPAATNREQSGDQARARNPSLDPALNVFTAFQCEGTTLDAFHTQAVCSALPVTIRSLSGDHATPFTQLE